MTSKAHGRKSHPTTTASSRLPKGFMERRVTVDGLMINYTIGGQGPLVLLLHGYAQTSHMWRPLMPLLATSHTVIAPDLRGGRPVRPSRGRLRQKGPGPGHSRSRAPARLPARDGGGA